jgi:hypothetical protein
MSYDVNIEDRMKDGSFIPYEQKVCLNGHSTEIEGNFEGFENADLEDLPLEKGRHVVKIPGFELARYAKHFGISEGTILKNFSKYRQTYFKEAVIKELII